MSTVEDMPVAAPSTNWVAQGLGQIKNICRRMCGQGGGAGGGLGIYLMSQKDYVSPLEWEDEREEEEERSRH